MNFLSYEMYFSIEKIQKHEFYGNGKRNPNPDCVVLLPTYSKASRELESQ